MKALLVTIGSLGDLHPFIAIGRALAAHGVAVTLAVPADHVDTVRAAGLDAAAILPSLATVCATLGIDEAEAARRVVTQRSFVMDAIVMPALGPSCAALDALADGADVIVASLFAIAGGIVAEKRGIPLVALTLQPAAMLSAWDPPTGRGFAMMAPAPTNAVMRRWNRWMIAAVRAGMRLRYGPMVARVRQAQGLAATRGAPLFDPVPAQRLTLCCYAPAFAPVPPDAPPETVAIGFPLFDRANGRDAPLDPALAAFLEQGLPPLVFTLGSFLVHRPGDFYAEAAAAVRALGRRAVLLTGGGDGARVDGGILTMAYAPHSLLFGRAAAVVHHGGIGTTGQALRAGVPQLVVPFFGDQFDNARRIVRLGAGATLDPRAFRGKAAVAALDRLLAAPAIAARAAALGETLRQEEAADAAAMRIMALVRAPSS